MSLGGFCFQNRLVPTEKINAHKPIFKDTLCRPFKRTWFLLELSWACTIRKVHGLSLEQIAISFNLKK